MTYYPSSASLLPGRDGYDVGSPEAPWQDGYYSQSLSVGFSSPPYELSIAGDGYFTGFVRVGDTGDSASTAGAGAIRFAGGALLYSDGTSWKSDATTDLSNLSSTAISADLNPATDDGYSLGTPSLRWKDGYFGPNSLHLVSTSGETGIATHWSLRLDDSGNIRIDETSGYGGLGIGDVSVNEALTIGSAISFKDGYVPTSTTGYGKAYVKNDGKLYFLTGSGTEYDLTSGGGGGTPAGSSGAVQFNASGSFAADTSNFFWDDTNNYLGIGTSNPIGPLDTRGDVYVGVDSAGATSVLKGFSTAHNSANQNSIFRFGVADGSFSGMSIESTRTGSFNSEGIVFFTHQGGVAQRRSLEISYTGAINMNSGGFSTASVTIAGDTDTSLFFTDAAADKVGIGTNSPPEKFAVQGVQALAHTTAPSATSGYAKLYAKSSDGLLYWKSAAGTEYTMVPTAPGGSSGGIQFNSSGSFGADTSNLFWDDTNDRLGIRTSSPGHTFQIAGGTQTASSRTFQVDATLPNGTTYEDGFRFMIISGGTGATNNGCRAGLIYLGPGYSGAADVAATVSVCEAVSTGTSADPVTGVAVDCGATGTVSQAYGSTSSGINFGSQSWSAQALLNVGHRSTVGFFGFTQNGFVINSLNIAQINTVSLAKNSSSSSERHFGSVSTGAGGDYNIGAISGLGLTRSIVSAYSFSAAHVFDNSSASAPIWVALDNGSEVARLADGGNLGVGVSSPVSKIDTSGSFGAGIVTKTSDYTADPTDHTLLGDATSGTLTFTLPSAASSVRRIYSFKKIDSSGNSVVIDGAGSETIDGATTLSLTTQYQKVVIQSDGTSWWVVG